MWAVAQCYDRHPNIDGTLCWMMLKKSRKCRSGAIWVRKKGTLFSATTRPTYMNADSYS